MGETAESAPTPASQNDGGDAPIEQIQTATDPATAAAPAEVPTVDPPAMPVSTTIAATPPATVNTKHAAWILGGRFSLAALANERGIAADEVPKWFDEARATADSLEVPLAALPERPLEAPSDTPSREVLGYILEQEKTIGPKLAAMYGEDHDAMFRLSVRTNLLRVLNRPGSKAVDTLSKSITELGPRSGLPSGLWQPLIGAMHDGATSAAIRAAVPQMHEKVEQHLAAEHESR
jgi:hypothetical protein